jgi:hypothetical protein
MKVNVKQKDIDDIIEEQLKESCTLKTNPKS